MLEAISALGGLAPIVAVVVIFAVLIILFLKWILAYMKDKDIRFIEHINNKDKAFVEVINNHMSEDKATRERMTNALNNLEKAVDRFLNHKI